MNFVFRLGFCPQGSSWHVCKYSRIFHSPALEDLWFPGVLDDRWSAQTMGAGNPVGLPQGWEGPDCLGRHLPPPRVHLHRERVRSQSQDSTPAQTLCTPPGTVLSVCLRAALLPAPAHTQPHAPRPVLTPPHVSLGGTCHSPETQQRFRPCGNSPRWTGSRPNPASDPAPC